MAADSTLITAFFGMIFFMVIAAWIFHPSFRASTFDLSKTVVQVTPSLSPAQMAIVCVTTVSVMVFTMALAVYGDIAPIMKHGGASVKFVVEHCEAYVMMTGDFLAAGKMEPILNSFLMPIASFSKVYLDMVTLEGFLIVVPSTCLIASWIIYPTDVFSTVSVLCGELKKALYLIWERITSPSALFQYTIIWIMCSIAPRLPDAIQSLMLKGATKL